MVSAAYAKLPAGPDASGPMFVFPRDTDAKVVLTALGRHVTGWGKLRAAARSRWQADPALPDAFDVGQWPAVQPAVSEKTLSVRGDVAVLTGPSADPDEPDEPGPPIAHFRRIDGAWRWDATAQFELVAPTDGPAVARVFAAYADAAAAAAGRLDRDELRSPADLADELDRATCRSLLAGRLTDDPAKAAPAPLPGERRRAAGLGRLAALAVSPDGKQFAVGAVTAAVPIRLLNSADGTPVRSIAVGGFGLFDAKKVAYAPDGKRLAVLGTGYRADAICRAIRGGPPGDSLADLDGADGVWVFDTATGARVMAVTPRHGSVDGGVAFSPHGTHVAFGGTGVAVYEVATGKAAYSDNQRGTAVGFAPDGSLLAVRFNDHLTVVDWRGNRTLKDVPLSDARADEAKDTLIVSPDGRSAYYATLAGAIQIDLVAGRQARRFDLPGRSGVNRVNALALSPDGALLLGAAGLFSLDDPAALSPMLKAMVPMDSGRQACLWAVDTGRLVARYPNPAKAVSGAVFVDGGRGVVSASTDGVLRAWAVPAGP